MVKFSFRRYGGQRDYVDILENTMLLSAKEKQVTERMLSKDNEWQQAFGKAGWIKTRNNVEPLSLQYLI